MLSQRFYARSMIFIDHLYVSSRCSLVDYDSSTFTDYTGLQLVLCLFFKRINNSTLNLASDRSKSVRLDQGRQFGAGRSGMLSSSSWLLHVSCVVCERLSAKRDR